MSCRMENQALQILWGGKLSINQQDKRIIGVVLDDTGTPVIGANVLVKGTTIGTITDMDGRFSLEAPADAVLQISYIGFLTQEITVGNKNEISISLSEDAEA